MTSPTENSAVPTFRLSLRCEGEMWVAYCAPLGTMKGAVLIGSIRLDIAGYPAVRDAFIQSMQAAAGVVAETLYGKAVVHWGNPVAAPEHERYGHA